MARALMMGLLTTLPSGIAKAQQAPRRTREFPPGTVTRIEDLPASRLRTRLEGLPAPARERAAARLRRFHFTELDLNSLQADEYGDLLYEDHFPVAPAAAQAAAAEEPVVAAAALAAGPLPNGLLWHSKPGAPNVLYLNFTGETVSGTRWNTSLGRSQIPAVAFSTDSDYSTFSDAEQTAIRRIWQRVAEDYAPFNIDVTTERPTTLGTRTAHALITRNTDANGAANPSSTAGGVAYVDAFGDADYSAYRPGWIYVNNLGNSASSIAEAVSHEIGHNLGLSHDGQTDGTEYYGGHGSGNSSWGPIMGASYGRNITQWSKGEYYRANNTQDDLAVIAAKISYRTDDRGDLPATAASLVITGETNVVSTTPESDPTNANSANKGVLQRNTDVDVFSFTTGSGPIRLRVNPWITPSGTLGGNLDIVLELRDALGSLLLTNNPASDSAAQIQTTLSQGTYYLFVRNSGVGNPWSSAPSGYTAYGSIGQYFISGYIAPSSGVAATRQFTASVNNAAWGSVMPASGLFPAASLLQVTAIPARWYRFVGWTNGVTGTNNPLTVLLSTNVFLQATFAETLTTNHPTPLWWLAASGYTNNFETAVNILGANGIPLWESWLAGLNPADPSSRLQLSISRGAGGAAQVLHWNTVSNRTYSVWATTNLTRPFTPVAGATNLPATVRSFTNAASPAGSMKLYRLAVSKP